MPLGERELPNLTDENREDLEFFDWIVFRTGVCTYNIKEGRLWLILWTTLSATSIFLMTWTIYHYRNNFDLAAYGIHHLVLFVDDIVIAFLLYFGRDQILHIIEASKKTYEYDSELINSFCDDVIKIRTGRSSFMRQILTWSWIGIMSEVMVFFIIEETVFKSYRTIYPFYIGLDLNDPVVYSVVILWQLIICIITASMPIVVCCVGYIMWSHLDQEMDILIFAINHVQEAVEEQMRRPLGENVERKTGLELYDNYVYHFAKHHSSIIKCFDQFNEAMRNATTFMFGTGLVLMVTVLLSLLSDNTGIKLKLVGFLLAQVFVIFGWCWVGQYISDKGLEVSEAVSYMPWWLMSKSSHSTLRILLIGSQRHLAITSRLGQEANKECFMDLCSNVYQCLNLIYQLRYGG